MAQLRLAARLPETLIQRGGDAFTLAITDDAYVGWHLRVFAHLQDGARQLGEIYTVPRRQSGAPPGRVIAAGCLPGAQAWSIEGLCLAPAELEKDAPVTNDLTLDLSVGVGMQAPSFIDFEYRPQQMLSGTNGVVTLFPWQRLRSWYARAVVDSMMQIGNQAPLTIDAGTALAGDAGGPTVYGVTVTFTTTARFVVQVEG